VRIYSVSAKQTSATFVFVLLQLQCVQQRYAARFVVRVIAFASRICLPAIPMLGVFASAVIHITTNTNTNSALGFTD
jgi:hypothetical protein